MSAPSLVTSTPLRTIVGGHRNSVSFVAPPLPTPVQPHAASAPVTIRQTPIQRRQSRHSVPERRASSSPPKPATITMQDLQGHLSNYDRGSITLDEVVDFLYRHLFPVRGFIAQGCGAIISTVPNKKIELIKRLVDDSAKTQQDGAPLRENDLASAFYREFGLFKFQGILHSCARDKTIFESKDAKKIVSTTAKEEKKSKAKDSLLKIFIDTLVEHLKTEDRTEIKIIHRHICEKFQSANTQNKIGFVVIIFLNRIVTPYLTSHASRDETTKHLADRFKEFSRHLQRSVKDLQDPAFTGEKRELLETLGTLLW